MFTHVSSLIWFYVTWAYSPGRPPSRLANNRSHFGTLLCEVVITLPGHSPGSKWRNGGRRAPVAHRPAHGLGRAVAARSWRRPRPAQGGSPRLFPWGNTGRDFQAGW